MDFVSGQLFNGQKIRVLTLVNNFSRECLATETGRSFKAVDVVRVLEELKEYRQIIPKRIQVDNGSEFISKQLDRWSYENKVTLDFSRPAKPTDNPFVESFNGSLRDECLKLHWFLFLEDAKEKIGIWKEEYNHFRPHSSWDDMTVAEVVEKHGGKIKRL